MGVTMRKQRQKEIRSYIFVAQKQLFYTGMAHLWGLLLSGHVSGGRVVKE